MSRSMALANPPPGHWEYPLLSAGHWVRTPSKCLERGSPWAGYSWSPTAALGGTDSCDMQGWGWERRDCSQLYFVMWSHHLYILNHSHCCSWGASRLAVTVVDKLFLVQFRVDSSIQGGGSSLSRISEHSCTKAGNTHSYVPVSVATTWITYKHALLKVVGSPKYVIEAYPGTLLIFLVY